MNSFWSLRSGENGAIGLKRTAAASRLGCVRRTLDAMLRRSSSRPQQFAPVTKMIGIVAETNRWTSSPFSPGILRSKIS
jgi:hypothetical protein